MSAKKNKNASFPVFPSDNCISHLLNTIRSSCYLPNRASHYTSHLLISDISFITKYKPSRFAMVVLTRLLTALVLSTAAWAAPKHYPRDVHNRTTLVPPSKDGFYSVPHDFLDKAPPGTILSHRKVPAPFGAFKGFPIKIHYSHQILYRTTDSLGNATATVMTVLIPFDADFTRLLSFQVGQDSPSIDCAPSYTFQLESKSPSLATQTQVLSIQAALERSWVVIIPDFGGPHAAFSATRLAGQATLDGIRAAIKSGEFTGIEPNPTITMWGYSGGALASAWAAELQHTYAPELKINGAALGGIIPNLVGSVNKTNGRSMSGLIPAALVGLSRQYPYVAEMLEKQVRPEHKSAFEKVSQQCSSETIEDFRQRDVLKMFDDPNVLFSDPEMVKIFEQNNLGHGTPKVPLYVYKSIGDEISPVADSDALVYHYCNGGSLVQYQRDMVSDHATLAVLGLPKALSWLSDITAAEGPVAGCLAETVSSSILDTKATKSLPKFILDAVFDLVGTPIGPPPP